LRENLRKKAPETQKRKRLSDNVEAILTSKKALRIHEQKTAIKKQDYGLKEKFKKAYHF
jgi:hypothetical protein